jgi:hypothetical protein
MLQLLPALERSFTEIGPDYGIHREISASAVLWSVLALTRQLLEEKPMTEEKHAEFRL